MATLNPALRPFWKTPGIRNRILYGGRSSSKSWDAAGVAIAIAQSCKVRVLCARQYQNKITESVYTLLKIQIERFGLQDDFDILNNSIRHRRTGSEFLFYGLWRHIDEIKSLEGVDICWIEEAHNLSQNQWEILEPTIRKEGSQFWIVFNPRLVTDFVYKRFVRNPPPKTLVRHINYDENPFLTNTMLDVIEAKKNENYADFQHVYLGLPRDDDDSVVIKRSWVQSAIDAHKTVPGDWYGPAVVGFDVADDGADANATTTMRGAVCVHLDEWQAGENELDLSSKRAKRTATDHNAVMIGYDSIGVGAGVGAFLNGFGWRRHFKFNAGAKTVKPEKKYKDTKIMNKDYFSNLKAQRWWELADRFRNTFNAVTRGQSFKVEDMISISSECDAKLLEQLMDELTIPLRDEDNFGRVKVESKKDLKKRDIDSPNIADSFIIANSSSMMGRRNLKDYL